MALPPVAWTGTSTMPERLCSPFLSVARRIFPCTGHVESAQSCGSSPVCCCSHLHQISLMSRPPRQMRNAKRLVVTTQPSLCVSCDENTCRAFPEVRIGNSPVIRQKS